MDTFGMNFSMDISSITENMEKMEEKIKAEEDAAPLDKQKSEASKKEPEPANIVVTSKKIQQETSDAEPEQFLNEMKKFYVDENDVDKHDFFIEGEIVNIYENKDYLMIRVCPYKNSPSEYRPKPQVMISKKSKIFGIFKKENFQMNDAVYVKGEILSQRGQNKEGVVYQSTAYFVTTLRRAKKQTNEDPFYDRFNLSASRVNKNFAICSGIVSDIKVYDNRIKFKLICKYGPKEDDVTSILCHYMVQAHDYSILSTIIQGKRVAVTGSIHTDHKHTNKGNIHFQDFVIDTVNNINL